MKLSKGKVLISVLCFLFGILCLVSAAFMIITSTMTEGTKGFAAAASEREEGCAVRFAGAKEIGKEYSVTYGDETITYTTDYADYTIYELTFYVTNQGLEEMYSADPGISISGEEYSDAYSLWMYGPDYEETPLFYYDSKPYIPACCTAEVKLYMQVKDGVHRLTVSYYPSYDYETEESFEITI